MRYPENCLEDRVLTTSLRPVSIITVAYDSLFWVRLLVEKVREFIGEREYEIIVVDRGSRDGSKDWLRKQPDVRVMHHWQWRRHNHGEAAEAAVRKARHPYIVLLDSDAHPTAPDWLALTVDILGDKCRLVGPRFEGNHKGNRHRWYAHPYFMAFFKEDVGRMVVLRKVRGHDTDTGEEATIRQLDAGLEVHGLPIEFCERFGVGNPRVPTVSGGVFHAWYVTRLGKDPETVAKETNGEITVESYLKPLQAKLREAYGLDY
jgi:glycosyltransferase involved in cell wall biosynthesis